VSFLLLATIVAAAGAAGFTWGRRDRVRRDDVRASPTSANVSKPTVKKADDETDDADEAWAPSPDLERLAVTLGDVVSFDREERWLAGALVARDGHEVIGALFFAPEGSRHEVVAAFPAPRRELYWLSPVGFEAGHEPPSSVELGGGVLERKTRRPAKLERLGQGAPSTGDEGLWAEYASPGGARAVIVRTSGGTFAYVGRVLQHGEYDRMGRGS